jgi:hypothetical protein
MFIQDKKELPAQALLRQRFSLFNSIQFIPKGRMHFDRDTPLTFTSIRPSGSGGRAISANNE